MTDSSSKSTAEVNVSPSVGAPAFVEQQREFSTDVPGEEVLGVEGVPFHSHHLAAVALEHKSDVDSTSLVCASMVDCKHDEYAHSFQ